MESTLRAALPAGLADRVAALPPWAPWAAGAGAVGALALRWFSALDGDVRLATSRVKPSWWDGRVVWVTGASGGIGAEVAREAARMGATVVLSARREKELEAVRASCEHPDRHGVVVLDATDTDSHEGKVAEVLRRFGRIDTLVLNAGRGGNALAVQTDMSATRAMINLNVVQCVSLTRLVAPHMLDNADRRGSIVVVSSLAGKIAVPGSSSYSLSKWALHGYFGAVRAEVAGNVDVCLVCPGPVETDFGTNRFVSADGGSRMSAATGGKRMSARRCAQLITVAASNALPESWISGQPELFMTYLVQYAPETAALLLAPIVRRLVAPMVAAWEAERKSKA